MATTLASSARTGSRTSLLALLFIGFVLTGIPTVIVGPILPVFISRWSLNDSQAGFFFTVQFAASLCGVWIATALTSWRGYRYPLVLGYVLTGAVLALRHQLLSSLLLTVASGALLLAGSFLLVTFPVDAHRTARESTSSLSAPLPAVAITIAISALFFIYVGTETSLGGWAAEHAKRLAGHASGLSTVAPMFFYAGLMTGRGLAPLVLLHVRENRLALATLGITALGGGILIASTFQRSAIVGLTIAGLGCSSIYPIYISWFSRWYGAAARRLGGVVFSLASLGGSALPWLVGFVSKQSGSLRIGLLIPFFCPILMIGVLLL